MGLCADIKYIFAAVMRLLFLGIFLLWTLLLEAQTFRGYVLVGGNMSQVDGDNLAGFHKAGLGGGAGVFYDLSDRWRSSLGFIFNQNGARATSRELGLSSTLIEEIQLNYVTLPVDIHFMDWLSPDEYYYRLEFFAGLEYRRLINFSVTDINGADLSEAVTYRPNGLAGRLGVWYAMSYNWAGGFIWNQAILDLNGDPNERRLSPKQVSLQLRRTF